MEALRRVRSPGGSGCTKPSREEAEESHCDGRAGSPGGSYEVRKQLHRPVGVGRERTKLEESRWLWFLTGRTR